MRKLMWLTLGFGAACALCVYFLPRESLMVLTGFGFIGAAVIGVPGRSYRTTRASALILLGCALGFGWYLGYYHFYLKDVAAMDGKTETASIHTSDYSYETAYGIAVDGVITMEEKTYQVRAYLDSQEEVLPGTTLEGPFHFRVTTPDGEEEATSHPGKGIFLLAYQEDELVTTAGNPESLRERTSVLRQKIREILRFCFPADTYPFAKALLLGDTTDLSYETDTDLKISGIRHVVAVSGLHVSILFALITALTFRRRFLSALAGFPALLLFAAVAGFSPSVTRACIMSGLMLLALLAKKEYDSATALSFAVLVMLMGNPLVITSVSFQLSVASVAGICLFNSPIRSWILFGLSLPADRKARKTVIRWLSSSVSVTLSAMTLTTPLCALYFGTISLIGVVTNLLTLWIISFIFYGLMAVCLLFLLWEAGAVLLAKAVSLPIRLVLATAGILADVPLSAVYTRSPYITAWLVFAYSLLILLLISKNRKPMVLSCCAALGLCAALTASWAEPMLDSMRMTVLDVGQGQCILLQSEGKTYMVDCGGDSDTRTADIAAETLLSQGISRLDGLILTHCDRDHAGAAANLMSRIDVDLLILPPVYTELAQHCAGEMVFASENINICWENTALNVYSPNFPGSSNENSLCVLFDTEKCDILITGDRNGFGERMLLRFNEIPDVDVLMAGHHGSQNSTCGDLLLAVRPETVCISAGEGNSYGHPAPALLARLREFGCDVYRTDKHGTILIRR